MDLASDVTGIKSLTAKFPSPLALTLFLPHLPQCTWSLRYRSIFVDVSIETKLCILVGSGSR